MTFKWTYLLVVAVVLAAVLAPALTGGGWGAFSYAWGVGLIIIGAIVIYFVSLSRPASGRVGGAAPGAVPPAENETTPPFAGYPKDRALGIFDAEDDARLATEELKAAGYDEVDRYAGAAGAASLDSQGRAHGAAASAERAIESVVSDEADLADYDAAVRAGNIVLGVLVVDGDRRHHVARIMHRHRGHDVRYFGSLAAESLSVDPGRVRAD